MEKAPCDCESGKNCREKTGGKGAKPCSGLDLRPGDEKKLADFLAGVRSLGSVMDFNHVRPAIWFMLAMAIFIALVANSGCVVYVDGHPEDEGDTYNNYYDTSEDDCDPLPHDHRPERCDVYEGRDCCEWYTGNTCYQLYCLYHHNCEWHWYGERCDE